MSFYYSALGEHSVERAQCQRLNSYFIGQVCIKNICSMSKEETKNRTLPRTSRAARSSIYGLEGLPQVRRDSRHIGGSVVVASIKTSRSSMACQG